MVATYDYYGIWLFFTSDQSICKKSMFVQSSMCIEHYYFTKLLDNSHTVFAKMIKIIEDANLWDFNHL